MDFGIFTMVTNMGATWFSEGCGPQVPGWKQFTLGEKCDL
jgi:hypothetical protein